MNNTNIWKRNFEYILCNFKIAFKKIIEYKANFYSMFFDLIFWFASQFFIIYIIQSNFSDVISWTTKDFILFIGLGNLLFSFLGIFWWGSKMFYFTKQGKINTYLTKPINIKIQAYFNEIDETGLIFIFIVLLYNIFLITYFNIELQNIVLGIIILILIIINLTLFWITIDSTNLLIIGFSKNFQGLAIVNDNFLIYPSQFFSNSKIKFFFNIIPTFFTSSILVLIFKNEITKSVIYQIILLLGLTLILFTVFNIIWYYGLKKYEAFG